MPNRSGRASVLNSQLSLDRTAYATKQPVVGAFVRAALTRQGKGQQQGDEWNHEQPDGGISRIVERTEFFHRPKASKIWYPRSRTSKSSLSRKG
jgi:hypothetical protein